MDRQLQRRPARPLVELQRLRNARQLQRRWQTGRIGDLPREIIWRIWDIVEVLEGGLERLLQCNERLL